jgi:DNA-binding TFAR19-related protein (PDSD5 family)
MLRRVDLVKTDVSEEVSASIIRMTRIGKLRTRLALTEASYEEIRSIIEIFAKYNLKHQVEENEVGGTCGMNGGRRGTCLGYC